MIIPDKATVDDIFSDPKVRYLIPKYQRNFDWGKSETKELVDDLVEVAEGDTELYLGSFIYESSDKKEFHVVDGQQRMTTLSLVVIAIREHAKKINESEYAGEMQKYLTFTSAWSKEKGCRLVASPSVNDVFEYISSIDWGGMFPDSIEGKGVKRQVNRIRPIYNTILNSIQDYNIDRLKEFTRALMTAYVTVLHVEGAQDVFSIFERTNARGLDLNIGDLLKNYIYSQGTEEYEDAWQELMANADGSAPRMFKYFWVSRRGYTLQSELYKNLRSYGKSEGMEKFVNELQEFSRYYAAVRKSDESAIKSWLISFDLRDLAGNSDALTRITMVFQALKLFRVTQAYPIIFSSFLLYRKDKSGNKDKLLELLQAIEKYHFVNNVIVSRIGNEVEKYYAEKASAIYDEEHGFKKVATEVIQELRKKKASKAEYVSSFVENVIYDPRDTSLINYIFDRINNYKTKGAQIVKIFNPDANITHHNYNVDHILPQSFESEYSEEDAQRFDKIGNLIVLARHSNSEFQDLPPAEKAKLIASDKKHFGNLRYIDDLLNEYKDEFLSWDLDTIDRRSHNIASNTFDQAWNF